MGAQEKGAQGAEVIWGHTYMLPQQAPQRGVASGRAGRAAGAERR